MSLTPEQIKPLLLGALFQPERFHYHPLLDSTNREAARLAKNGHMPEGTLIVADAQTCGRGRMGRSWVSPPGNNLAFSLILRPTDILLKNAPQLTLLGAVAMVEAISQQTGYLNVTIKWPNDLMIGDRKLAGILTEASSRGDHLHHLIMGVGVNVNGVQGDFPEEIQSTVITLRDVLGKNTDRSIVLIGFLEKFEVWYQRYLQDGFSPIRTAWLRNAALLDHPVRVVQESGAEIQGTALEMDASGALLVRLHDGTVVRVVAGEVLIGEFW